MITIEVRYSFAGEAKFFSTRRAPLPLFRQSHFTDVGGAIRDAYRQLVNGLIDYIYIFYKMKLSISHDARTPRLTTGIIYISAGMTS